MTVSLKTMNKNMIDGQLKPMGINNPIILEAFENVPREVFIDEEKSSLSYHEGNILVKLIYRETKISTYKLLKQYRGSLNAMFWQTLAKMYDNNLKQAYDPENIREDMFIEHIIIQAKLEGQL